MWYRVAVKNLILTLSAIICLIILTVTGYVVLDVFEYGKQPAGEGTQQSLFQITPGHRFDQIASQLNSSGIIQKPAYFRMIARYKNMDKKIRAGEYLLSPAMSPNQILDIMVSGKVYLHKVTIPEGFNLYQIAALFSDAGLVSETGFIQSAGNADLVHQKDINAATFEGYLYPDTYFFPRGSSAEGIISAMVDRFKNAMLPEYETLARNRGFTVHQIVTLASIIEKETGSDQERPLIASVFYNRIKKNMRLESDPTVIYGIENFDGNITRRHLSEHTPYNTYRISGLPPGPIANPGIQSIKAALYPAESDYLFFVSRNDRTHQFSRNKEEHDRAVRLYQMGK
jgi:UPF0755 protein